MKVKLTPEMIDEYGSTRDSIKSLTAKRAEVEKILNDYEYGEYEGANYRITIKPRIDGEIDAKAACKKVGMPNFLKVVKVLKTKIVQFLSMAEIDKMTDYKETKTYSYTKKQSI